MKQERFIVKGMLTIPVEFSVYSNDKEEALRKAIAKLNDNLISVIDGDIHTWCGGSYPILIQKCNLEWTDVE